MLLQKENGVCQPRNSLSAHFSALLTNAVMVVYGSSLGAVRMNPAWRKGGPPRSKPTLPQSIQRFPVFHAKTKTATRFMCARYQYAYNN